MSLPPLAVGGHAMVRGEGNYDQAGRRCAAPSRFRSGRVQRVSTRCREFLGLRDGPMKIDSSSAMFKEITFVSMPARGQAGLSTDQDSAIDLADGRARGAINHFAVQTWNLPSRARFCGPLLFRSARRGACASRPSLAFCLAGLSGKRRRHNAEQ